MLTRRSSFSRTNFSKIEEELRKINWQIAWDNFKIGPCGYDNISLDDCITGFEEINGNQLSEEEKNKMQNMFDAEYFGSYEKVDIHRWMIRDEVRTVAYKESLLQNSEYLQGKIVLDVGCGTGILSLFAMQAGAKEVFGIERSNFADHATNIIRDSKWKHSITVLKGSAESVELPYYRPRVDVILSEWMGYCLLYESMLETVLYARDKWLTPGGLMFPEFCSLYIFASEDMDFYEYKFCAYDAKLHGLDLSVLRKVSLGIPVIKRVSAGKVVTTSAPLVQYDLYKVKKEEICNFQVNFKLVALKDDYVNSLTTYFDVAFPKIEDCSPIILSTGPLSPSTHWKHTSFFLNGFITIFKKEVITGTFKLMQNAKNKRRIDIIIKVDYEGKGGSFHQINEYSLI